MKYCAVFKATSLDSLKVVLSQTWMGNMFFMKDMQWKESSVGAASKSKVG